jgi:hypothetical protein
MEWRYNCKPNFYAPSFLSVAIELSVLLSVQQAILIILLLQFYVTPNSELPLYLLLCNNADEHERDGVGVNENGTRTCCKDRRTNVDSLSSCLLLKMGYTPWKKGSFPAALRS